MHCITVVNNKTLKLSNVISYSVDNSQFSDLNTAILRMDDYIRSKGCQPIGPIIQHTVPVVAEDGTIEIHTQMMRQSNGYILHTEAPYHSDSVLRAKNCMFAHYCGDDTHIKLAIDKIRVMAFEDGTDLKEDSWLIYLNQSTDTDDVFADVFIERK